MVGGGDRLRHRRRGVEPGAGGTRGTAAGRPRDRARPPRRDRAVTSTQAPPSPARRRDPLWARLLIIGGKPLALASTGVLAVAPGLTPTVNAKSPPIDLLCTPRPEPTAPTHRDHRGE